MQKIIQRTTRDGRSVTQTTITICDGGPDVSAEVEKIKAAFEDMQERGRRQFLWAAVGGMTFLLVEMLAFALR